MSDGVEPGAHVCAHGMGTDDPTPEGHLRLQLQNLRETVRDAVGEMCPNPAPATAKGAGDGAFRFVR
jgi:hypothetical protein